MSADKLKLIHRTDNSHIEVSTIANNLYLIEVKNPEEELAGTIIDRGQAHLLMLYLQDHLGEKKKEEPVKQKQQDWYCPRCSKHHAWNYICARLL